MVPVAVKVVAADAGRAMPRMNSAVSPSSLVFSLLVVSSAFMLCTFFLFCLLGLVLK